MVWGVRGGGGVEGGEGVGGAEGGEGGGGAGAGGATGGDATKGGGRENKVSFTSGMHRMIYIPAPCATSCLLRPHLYSGYAVSDFRSIPPCARAVQPSPA